MLKALKKLIVSILLVSNIFSSVVFAHDNSAARTTQTQDRSQVMCILDADKENRE